MAGVGSGPWGSSPWGFGGDAPPVTGWGVSAWGGSNWGAGIAGQPEAPTASVTSVDVFSANLICVTFDKVMKNNSAAQDVTKYTITPDGAGQPVIITGVKTGNGITFTAVYLVITDFTVGETYTVVVSPNVRTAAGNEVSPITGRGKFIGRATKIDSMVNSRPGFYDTRPNSILGNVLTAIGRQDDLIGGSRDDDF